MEMQPPISDPAGLFFPSLLPLTHRRSISDSDLLHLADPFTNTFDKIAPAEGDHLLDPFMNMDFFCAGGVDGLDRRNEDVGVCESGGSGGYGGVWEAVRRSQSSDCLDGIVEEEERKETVEPKKAMSADKLAELWIVDPKRAKRITANRQSAARSKERKARYVKELEKKVQSLQREATTLSVQHSLFQRDTSSLIVENAELRRELEFMEQQAQLRDALNEALESELERLKVATGEKPNSEAYLIQPAFTSNHHSHPLMNTNLTKFEPDLNMYSQTNTIASPQQLHSLDTNFMVSCQPLYAPMLAPIANHGIDIGTRGSRYDHGR